MPPWGILSPTTLSLEEHALWFLFLLSNVTIFNETLLRQYPSTSFIFGCETHGMLVPRPGIRQAPPALEVQCLNPWTTKGSRACPLKCHQHTRHNCLCIVFLPLPLSVGQDVMPGGQSRQETAAVVVLCGLFSSGNQFHPSFVLYLFWQLGGSFPISHHLDKVTLGRAPTLPDVYFLHFLGWTWTDSWVCPERMFVPQPQGCLCPGLALRV